MRGKNKTHVALKGVRRGEKTSAQAREKNAYTRSNRNGQKVEGRELGWGV
jgi:hypothetical protein